MAKRTDRRLCAAKLLFQFRVVVGGRSYPRRHCEERTVLFTAATAREAVATARKMGRAGKFRYENSEGNPVHFEFVGIMDVLGLGNECDQNEVWYDVKERLRPMERRARILPREAHLQARLEWSWGSKRYESPWVRRLRRAVSEAGGRSAGRRRSARTRKARRGGSRGA